VKSGNVVVPPGTQLVNEIYPITGVDDAWCAANSMKPATFVQAHSAPLDIVFFDDAPTGALPERWRGGAFVSFHGSWDRNPPTGFKVVWIPFDASGNAPMPTSTTTDTTFPYEVVLGGGNASGPADGDWSWSAGDDGEGPRPVGVAVGPVDGALYIASDSGGYIYRVGIQK
jgi:glucose/arabinose dehydrogenase